jgi:quercetin dioxygenase-like cupin family protein
MQSQPDSYLIIPKKLKNKGGPLELKNIKNITPVYEKDGVTGRKLTSGDNLEVIHMTMEKGSYLLPHKTPFDAEFYASSGSAVFVIGEKEFKAAEGSIIFCPGNIEHGIRNDTDHTITVLVIKHLKQQ